MSSSGVMIPGLAPLENFLVQQISVISRSSSSSSVWVTVRYLATSGQTIPSTMSLCLTTSLSNTLESSLASRDGYRADMSVDPSIQSLLGLEFALSIAESTSSVLPLSDYASLFSLSHIVLMIECTFELCRESNK